VACKKGETKKVKEKLYLSAPWRHIDGEDLHLFLNSTLDGDDYLHAPKDLPWERTPVPISQGAGWAPGPVWTFWKKERTLDLTGVLTPDHPVTIHTPLIWLPLIESQLNYYLRYGVNKHFSLSAGQESLIPNLHRQTEMHFQCWTATKLNINANGTNYVRTVRYSRHSERSV
jgi:hypothetical protein